LVPPCTILPCAVTIPCLVSVLSSPWWTCYIVEQSSFVQPYFLTPMNQELFLFGFPEPGRESGLKLYFSVYFPLPLRSFFLNLLRPPVFSRLLVGRPADDVVPCFFCQARNSGLRQALLLKAFFIRQRCGWTSQLGRRLAFQRRQFFGYTPFFVPAPLLLIVYLHPIGN